MCSNHTAEEDKTIFKGLSFSVDISSSEFNLLSPTAAYFGVGVRFLQEAEQGGKGVLCEAKC